jgi:hypothetical protein
LVSTKAPSAAALFEDGLARRSPLNVREAMLGWVSPDLQMPGLADELVRSIIRMGDGGELDEIIMGRGSLRIEDLAWIHRLTSGRGPPATRLPCVLGIAPR